MTAIAHTLAAHLETTQPHIPPRQPTQVEQFVDAPPKDVYVNDWRKRFKQKQEAKENKTHGK